MWFIFSYWRAPSQRAPGGALQNAFSQLQQPTSLVHPQAQQGLQVLDTLLSTLGQIGGDSQVGGGSGLNRSRQSDRHPNIGHMQPKNRYAKLEVFIHCPIFAMISVYVKYQNCYFIIR